MLPSSVHVNRSMLCQRGLAFPTITGLIYPFTYVGNLYSTTKEEKQVSFAFKTLTYGMIFSLTIELFITFFADSIYLD